MRRVMLLVGVLVFAAAAHGQEQPIVRAEISPATVAVGEPAELTITVLVPTWFVRPSVYPSFELSNAITRTPADSSYPIRERVGNTSWSGIVRTFEIYPLVAARYRLGEQSISIAYANPGSDTVTVDAVMPEVAFGATVPAGAESLDPYLAGKSLKLGLEVEGTLEALEAGGAVVLKYSAELDGLPAIFLPPLVPELGFDGVSVYRDAPDVQDGEPSRRDETVTLVFEAGGEFVVPDLELQYWNTASQSNETVTATGTQLSVEGPPVRVAGDAVEKGAGTWSRMAGLIVALAVTAALFPLLKFLLRRYSEAAVRRSQTESHAFRQLKEALDVGQGEAAYSALLLWLARLAPGMTTREFASDYGDDELRAAVDALSAGLYGPTERPDKSADIKRKLKAARSSYLASQLSRRDVSLPPLNP